MGVLFTTSGCNTKTSRPFARHIELKILFFRNLPRNVIGRSSIKNCVIRDCRLVDYRTRKRKKIVVCAADIRVDVTRNNFFSTTDLSEILSNFIRKIFFNFW